VEKAVSAGVKNGFCSVEKGFFLVEKGFLSVKKGFVGVEKGFCATGEEPSTPRRACAYVHDAVSLSVSVSICDTAATRAANLANILLSCAGRFVRSRKRVRVCVCRGGGVSPSFAEKGVKEENEGRCGCVRGGGGGSRV